MLQGFHTSATKIAEHIDEAIVINFWLSVVLFFTVVAPMFYFAWKYRESNVKDEDIENVTHNTLLEVVWTVIPTIMILVFFWYGYTSMVTARTMPADEDSIVVALEGKKWSWNYTYPANANGFVHKTAELYVPVNQNVTLEMTTPLNDVIHAYFVPAFRMKEDLVPGRLTKQWFNSGQIGTYDVECAEYCGTRHSYMYSKIHVISQEEYDAWFNSELRTPGAENVEMSKGQELYEMNGCNGCHSLEDDSILVGPSLKGMSAEKSVQYMKDAIVNPDKDIPEGYTAGVMPAFVMSDDELNEILEYMKK